jgi:hypothetical protein
MVAVQMTDQNYIDIRWLDLHALHCAQDRRARFHQDFAAVTLDKVARLKAPAASKGITSSQKRYVNAFAGQ